MNIMDTVMRRRPMILTVVALLSILGLSAWLSMDRQEDPFFPYRYGHVLVPWPGAEPERIQTQVIELIENELATVDEVREIRSTARFGFAQLIVGLKSNVYDTDSVWDRIRVAIDRAERRLPERAGPIDLRDRSMDTHGIVLAIGGSDDLIELLDAARQLRRDLFTVPGIGRIDLIGSPDEELRVRVDPARLLAAGLSMDQLAQAIQRANRVVPGGALVVDERNLIIQSDSDLGSLEELAALPVADAQGRLHTLGELADLQLQPAEPVGERIEFNGQPVVALGVVIPRHHVNAVHFGEAVRERIEEVAPNYAPLTIEEMFYQPRWVEQRLGELGRSLLLGVLIVAAILLWAMGWRMGVIVAALLPLVTLSGLAIYALGGGILHQMSVAGMVIALGMLVDNAIVMVESLQWHIDRGKKPAQAAMAAARELAGPLAAATGTTLAAFLPLLLSHGDTADFTRGIPIMVMLVLVVSYAYAVLVTPAIAPSLLRAGSARESARLEQLGRELGQLSDRRPWAVLGGSALLVVAMISLANFLPRDFFPSTDRNQLIVDLNFPEGTRTETTLLHARDVANELLAQPSVRDVKVFAGFSGPRFYYNLMETRNAPHMARLVAITDSDRELPALIEWIDRYIPDRIPEAQIVARRLGQGPPVDAPVEVRLFGPDTQALRAAAHSVMDALRDIPGARDVRHRLGQGLPTLEVLIDEAEAARQGVSRDALAEVLARASRGQQVSTWRAEREPLPLLLGSREGERLPHEALAGLVVDTPNGPRPLDAFVEMRMSLSPAVIEHRDLQLTTAVLAETDPGVTYGQIWQALEPALAELELPEGVRVVPGGAAAEASNANQALFSTLPIGLLALLGFLMWQFNSLKLTGLVLLTVPLAAAGVVPGLLLSGQPFSFTAMLGVVALIGIVVNNAIVLIDRIEAGVADGLHLDQAIPAAVARRIRPILLTTATTIAGLLPLTWTQSTLWPPMAWAIISGLLVSTILTLIVLPAAYRVLEASHDRDD
ncbi:efflux RND transporter permease subunit [Wenzhouxiangella marina]|uniref:Putative AcrB/AcrD/AcrF family protein n=1 Tax=Wenzhouxiangella marina TaxID=1579979 RepID=A0A0K0XUI9_9GAMM|nr:efflux RND transporter permease subunit [Wenzhouxiangella marina]AKS41379.1 putative AcrB/AcrD/AcrF family protein precursor [Wenzhouxiangella marina]MBB6086867.1 multidrug efflux pump subunit AcrB [Wenzhouxiangella marina]